MARQIVDGATFFITTVGIATIWIIWRTYINVSIPEILVVFKYCQYVVNGKALFSWHAKTTQYDISGAAQATKGVA